MNSRRQSPSSFSSRSQSESSIRLDTPEQLKGELERVLKYVCEVESAIHHWNKSKRENLSELPDRELSWFQKKIEKVHARVVVAIEANDYITYQAEEKQKERTRGLKESNKTLQEKMAFL